MRTWLAFVCAALAGCGARSGLGVAGPGPGGAGGSPSPPAAGGGGSGGTPGLGGSGGSGGSPTAPVYCQNDAGPTTVFVVTAAANLYSFDPPSRTFTLVTGLSCASASLPETMAVNHQGTAFVDYEDGTLFAVDLASQSCAATAFSDGSNPGRFGSCFAADPGGQGETFFLVDGQASPNGTLFTVDTTTFAVSPVGPITSPIGGSELTGTGDGRLFAFGNGVLGDAGSSQGFLVQLDPTTAATLSEVPVPVPVGSGFAFSFWGGDFYFFTGATSCDVTGAPCYSTVSQLVPGGAFDPSYAMLQNENIVGAGVSTCAPVM